MSAFSVNQNRQFYVATELGTVSEASKAGVAQLKTIDNGVNKEMYLLVKGYDTVLKSDYIPVKNLSYVKAISAADMVTPLKVVKVSLEPSVNGGNVVVGQDYILRINFRQFYGMSDQDQYFKDVAVRGTSEMATTPKVFYDALVKALNLSFSREVGATINSNPYLKFEASEDGVTITEKEQDWTLGTQAQERVYFDVVPTTIYVNGNDEVWGKNEDETPSKEDAEVGTNAIGNGKKMADLEYFCLGERGDQYRKIGFPNDIETKGLVEANKEYNVLEIHYAFTDEGISSYRSEKDITIVSEDAAVINAIVKEINTATGLNIKGTDGAVPTSGTATDKAVENTANTVENSSKASTSSTTTTTTAGSKTTIDEGESE